jgi:broad specificity phosphatase PhoE
MPVFYVIRHASCPPLGRRLAGREPGVSLDAEGERQARALAERLAPVRLDAIYSSPLERARQTADWIARGRGLRVRISEGLDEIAFGAWTGLSFEELDRLPAWTRYNADRGLSRPPGGESMAEVQARALRELERLAAAHPLGALAVVSHADVIKAVVCGHLGLPLDFLPRIEISPASLSVLRVDEAGARLARLNDTGETRLA